VTEYSANILNLLADWRESIEKQSKDEAEADRVVRLAYQQSLQQEILVTMRKELWDAAGKVLEERAPYLVVVKPGVTILARGPLEGDQPLDEMNALAGDYVIKIRGPAYTLEMSLDADRFKEFFVRQSG
jgi:hypothetical protein